MDVLGPEIERMLTAGQPIDLAEWRRAVDDYFAREPQPNDIFNVLAGPWIGKLVTPALSDDLFLYTVRAVEEWDENHLAEVPRHKGTPYYWLGMAYILVGDLDRGFLYMHMAFDEDRRTSGLDDPDMPARAFVTMDSTKQNQAFKRAVDDYAARTESMMASYRQRTGGSLTVAALRAKVDARAALREDMFHLVYATARSMRLEQVSHRASSTPFGGNLLGQAMGDLCLVAEGFLREGWKGDGEFHAHAGRYLGNPRSSQGVTALDEVAAQAKRQPTQWGQLLTEVLNGTFVVRGRPLDARETDMAVTLLVRNRSAHDVTMDPVLRARAGEVERHIYAAIFGAAEHLQ